MDQAEHATIRPLNNEADTHRIGTSSLDTRNDLVPIYRLPPEILSLIFAELVLLCPPSDPYLEPKGLSKLRWINVTHVSRRWRETALHHPQLWTVISTDLGEQWMQEMLVRSKALPLDMQLVVQHVEDASFLSKHMSRTTRLFLEGEDLFNFDIQDNLIMQPAPMLETCTLFLVPEDDADIPVGLFANHVPRLRVLTLNVWSMCWTCPVLTGLVELSVTLCGAEIMDEPWEEREEESYCTEFFQALSQMSKLEILTLVNCLPKAPEAIIPETLWNPSSRSDVVNLVSLKVLNITGAPLDTAAFASCICLPSTCKVTVTFRLDMEDIRGDADGLLLLLPRLVGFLGQPVRRLAIRGSKLGDDYELSLWTRTHPWSDNLLFPAEATCSQHAESSSKPDIRIIASVINPSRVLPSLTSNMLAMPNVICLTCFGHGSLFEAYRSLISQIGF
ncbi:hypothetical protein EVG20_g8254 [Dentipellis fragilis]|uniref:F-box domain-containing protein n=1 Tax=Dentipellis fragilis TaxID=205917 RepID=A0A4Y9Y9N1_9AGAM|nr:hypothetical protein EVG20_g8254 [Dentipellis fragilis]